MSFSTPILDGVKQSHQYLVSLRFKTIGAVRDFLQGYPRDFAVVDEMVCSTKGSKRTTAKFHRSEIPELQNQTMLEAKRFIRGPVFYDSEICN